MKMRSLRKERREGKIVEKDKGKGVTIHEKRDGKNFLKEHKVVQRRGTIETKMEKKNKKKNS